MTNIEKFWVKNFLHLGLYYQFLTPFAKWKIVFPRVLYRLAATKSFLKPTVRISTEMSFVRGRSKLALPQSLMHSPEKKSALIKF